ncbi:MAG: tetratricopeptide repeat protein, partial [Desulfobacterales bacterium]|nr:tetratricopeptide repeat protein [Desulfobacterales bacterium]
AFLYPFPGVIPGWQIVGAVVFLAGVSWLSVRMITSKPYLAFGWMWYVGTLLPVIGLIQAGSWPEMADRWSYVPLVGLFIMLAWGIPDILKRWRHKKNILVSFTIILLLTFVLLTHLQIQYWRDSLTLFNHTLSITSGNMTVHNNIGVVLEKQGRIDEAIIHYEKALQIHPGYVDAHMNLGSALYSLGKYMKAIEHYQESIKLHPGSAAARFNLGIVLFAQKMLDEAIRYYKEALQLDPLYAEAHNNLGAVLLQQGRTKEAKTHFQEALRIRPDYAGAYRNLQKSISIDIPN